MCFPVDKIRFQVVTDFELVHPMDELLKSGWQVKQTWYGLRVCPCPCGKRDRGAWTICAFVFRKLKTVVFSFHLGTLMGMHAIPFTVFFVTCGFCLSDRSLTDKIGFLLSFGSILAFWEFHFLRFLKREFLYDYDCVCRELRGLLRCQKSKRKIALPSSFMMLYLIVSYVISWARQQLDRI